MRRVCLVLTGGGARAAYQVGVIKAIALWYPRVHHSPFSIYCGTSAGAINAISLASYCSSFRLGAKKLEWLWSRLTTERIFAASFGGISNHFGRMLISRLQSDHYQNVPFGLFDNRPLRHLLRQVVNFERLEKQIHHGSLAALSVTASRYHDGRSVAFFQGHNQLNEWQSSNQIGVRTRLYPEHLIASAAIPLLFPATKLNNHYYGDGSVHQLSPLKPAVNLGADRILIIDLRPKKSPPSSTSPPGLAQLGGHLMDTVFSDPLEADICHMHRLNNFLTQLTPAQQHASGLRHIEALHLRPSFSFEPLAEENYGLMPLSSRILLRMIGISPKQDAAITSYILFESDYIQSLIRRGFDDTMEREAEIKAFLR
uniref:patatin-like phospholipase family protein n=1 Tax=Thaumasiovibrio occultus TaxID=1891184 RepID=UPI000B361606|nr:patatin-like phospholipase family protein [Thaumasiovibrio occultus]